MISRLLTTGSNERYKQNEPTPIFYTVCDDHTERIGGGIYPQADVQRIVPDRMLLYDRRTLHPVKCPVSRDHTHYRICRSHHGTLPLYGHATQSQCRFGCT